VPTDPGMDHRDTKATSPDPTTLMSSYAYPSIARPPRRTPRATGTLTLMLLVTVISCGRTPPGGDPIEQEVFIQTYVDLRVAALDTDSQRLAAADREAILARHSVTAFDLTYFADVHASDLEFMRDVWNEVELRMDRPPEVSR